jgi:hypothetical protein
MDNKLYYKGFTATIEFDFNQLCIEGTIQRLNIEFTVTDCKQVELTFHKVVDNYLEQHKNDTTNFEWFKNLSIEDYAKTRIHKNWIAPFDFWYGDFSGKNCSRDEALQKEIEWLKQPHMIEDENMVFRHYSSDEFVCGCSDSGIK